MNEKYLLYFPAHPTESQELELIVARIGRTSFFQYLIICYSLFVLLTINPTLFEIVSKEVIRFFDDAGLNGVSKRYNELYLYDGLSNIAYISSLISASIIGVSILIQQVYAYKNCIMRKHIGHNLTGKSLVGFFCVIAFSWIFVSVTFFSRIHLVETSHKGMAVIFTWPFFPFIGILGVISISASGFTLIVSIWKLLDQVGKNRS